MAVVIIEVIPPGDWDVSGRKVYPKAAEKTSSTAPMPRTYSPACAATAERISRFGWAGTVANFSDHVRGAT